MTSATQTPARRTRLSGVERREQILDATKEIAADEGFHAVSIEAVARRAGISRPVVYNHFADLPGLLEALVERESARALGQLAQILPTDLGQGDSVDQLVTGLRGYLEAVSADPFTWRLVLTPTEGAPAVLHERIAQGRAGVVAVLAKAIEPGLGGRASPDPELTARTFSAVSDEGARLILTDPGNYSVERVVDHPRWWLGQMAGPSGA